MNNTDTPADSDSNFDPETDSVSNSDSFSVTDPDSNPDCELYRFGF